MNDLTTLARVKALVGDAIGVEAARIGGDTQLSEPRRMSDERIHLNGAGLDSLERLALGLAIQEHFSLEIPDADLDKPEMGTPAGIAAYIDRVLTGWEPPVIRTVTDPEEIKRFDAARVGKANYAAMMSSGELLAALGTDAQKWAQTFMQAAAMDNPLGRKLREYPHGDQNVLEEIMIGWFANAIESARGGSAPHRAPPYSEAELPTLNAEEQREHDAYLQTR
jgi:acyl carrier protein